MGRGSVAYFDIEGDNLLDGLTRLWCGVVSINGEVRRYTEDEIPSMVDDLNACDVIVGHNILDYDIPALEKITGKKVTAVPHDTLIGSRFRFPDMYLHDDKNYPYLANKGSHSLAAWGERLRFAKGDHSDWTQYSEEMMEYCVRDVDVTEKLYHRLDLTGDAYYPYCLEMRFAEFCKRIENRGFRFDLSAALALKQQILDRMTVLESGLDEAFPPAVTEMKTPEYWEMVPTDSCSKPDLVAVQAKTKHALTKIRVSSWKVPPKEVAVRPGPNRKSVKRFNPGSRKQVAEGLHKLYGWVAPTTEKGNPSIDDAVLSSLEYPEAKILAEYFMLKKRMGQLSEGENAWIKKQKGGVIRHRVNTIGCATGRVAHSSPNLGQIPATRSPYGNEFRGLFQPHEGFKLVGCDLSGIEARLLAHYLYPYDGGEFCEEVLNGDIHTANQKAAGLSSRDDAKTFFYALMYGAGATKIGDIVGGGAKEGQKLISSYMEKMPAFKKLTSRVQYMAETNGCIDALDGRQLPCRSPHSALNVLLQGGAAIIAKAWSNIMLKTVATRGLYFEPLAFVHDEVQAECWPEEVDLVGQIMVDSAVRAGEFYKLNVPLSAEYSSGDTWADTH